MSRPLFVFLATATSGCQFATSDAYTLYRDSAFDHTMRIHVATFDAQEGADYNSENCALAASLFQAQPGIATRFWCEKGAFRE